MRIILVIILYIGLVSACTQKPVYPEAMSDAIRCVEISPDSALHYLNSLSPATLQAEPEETRMYYDLLQIKANDKLYHPHKSDSTIKKIVRFYDEYGDLHKQMEAYYYLGSVYRDLPDAPRAIKAFQRVIELGENTTEYDLLGKAYGQSCILLGKQGVYKEAEKAGKKELEYNSLENDSIGIGYALRNIARTFHDRNQIDSALFYYMQGYERSPQRIKNIILSEVPWLYFDNGQPEKAKSLIYELFQKGRYSYNNWLLLGTIYLQEGDLGKARDCLNKVLEGGTIYQIQGTYQKLSELEERQGNPITAMNYANKCLAYQDSINRWTQTESVAKIQALYDFQHYEEENNKLQEINRHHLWLILALSIGSLFLIIGSVFYYYRLQYKKAKVLRLAKTTRLLNELAYQNTSTLMEENMQKIKDLEAQSHKTEEEKEYLLKRIREMEKEFSAYSKPTATNLQSKATLLEVNFKKSEIYHFFHDWTEHSQEKLTDEKWRELHTAIDTTYPRFTDRLLLLCPKLSEVELRICYLIKISIPIKIIASMLNRSNSAITNARIRMYKKVKGEDGKAEMFDQFISDL
ncbi:tetratricopeptide repeat protein [Parabacteroides sp.]